MVKSQFQRTRPECRFENLHTTATQKNVDCFNAERFCENRKTVFEAMGSLYCDSPCQDARPVLTEEHIPCGTNTRRKDEMRKQSIGENGYTVVKMWECEW